MIKELIKEVGGQQKAAKKSGVDLKTFRAWLLGHATPDLQDAKSVLDKNGIEGEVWEIGLRYFGSDFKPKLRRVIKLRKEQKYEIPKLPSLKPSLESMMRPHGFQ